MTRWTKADRVFVGVIVLPILSASAMFLLAGARWVSNDRQVKASMLQLIRSEGDAGAATSLTQFYLSDDAIGDDEEQRVSFERRWRKLTSAVALIQQWRDAQFSGQQQDDFLNLIELRNKDASFERLDQLNDRMRPILEELDDLLANSDVSLAAAYEDQIVYERFKYSQFDSSPLYAFYDLANVSLYHAILTDDSQAGMQAIKRLNQLSMPNEDRVMPAEAVFYYQAMLKQLRRTITQGFWNKSELEHLEAMLETEPDFAAAVQRHKHLTFLSLAYAMESPESLQNIAWLTQRYGSRFSRPKSGELTTVAPSELLTILNGLTSGNASEDANASANSTSHQSSGFDFDQWLKRPYMNPVFFPSNIAYQDNFEQLLLIVAKDRLFTRVAIAIAKHRQATGVFPGGLSELGDSLTPKEIALAKEVLDYEIVGGQKPVAQVTAKYAEWMKGADGELWDEGFSKRVTIP